MGSKDSGKRKHKNEKKSYLCNPSYLMSADCRQNVCEKLTSQKKKYVVGTLCSCVQFSVEYNLKKTKKKFFHTKEFLIVRWESNINICVVNSLFTHQKSERKMLRKEDTI